MDAKLSLIIFGCGGASIEAYTWIKQMNLSSNKSVFEVLGFVDKDDNQIGKEIIDGKRVISNDSQIISFVAGFNEINVVLPFGSPELKSRTYNKISKCYNLVFPNIIHPSVIYDRNTFYMGKGNIICPGVVAACNLTIGDFNLINRCVTIGHDVLLGDFNTVNPTSTISGNVCIGNHCLLGANSTILQDLKILDETAVGAGAVVTKEFPSQSVVMGVPAAIHPNVSSQKVINEEG